MTSATDANRQLGEVGTKLLMENDRVRIWEMRIEPGEESSIHRHDLDNILVQIRGDRMAVVPEADTVGIYNEYLEAEVEPGQIFYVEKGGVERARNVGKEAYFEILIELKD